MLNVSGTKKEIVMADGKVNLENLTPESAKALSKGLSNAVQMKIEALERASAGELEYVSKYRNLLEAMSKAGNGGCFIGCA
ncbi:MAG: hypothetical protein ABW120_11945 [Sedimenticola sp.]